MEPMRKICTCMQIIELDKIKIIGLSNILCGESFLDCIDLSFMLSGHTKFSLDMFFGLYFVVPPYLQLQRLLLWLTGLQQLAKIGIN